MIVRSLAFVVRVYSFVFHLSLSFFLLGIAMIALRSHQQLRLGMLPFDEEHALRNTILLGVIGVVCTLAAINRMLKFVFLIWTVVVLYLLMKGYLAGPYAFHGTDELKQAVWLILAAAIAFFGAAWAVKTQKNRGIF